MKKLQHIIEYILVKFWLSILSLLPLKYKTLITAAIFKFIGKRLKASKSAKQNIEMVFPSKFNSSELEEIVNQVWSNLGHIVAETPYLLSLSDDEFAKYVSLKGLENIKNISGRRALFFSAHLANWELLGKALAPYNITLNGVYREPNNKFVSALINKLRSKFVEGELFPKGKQGAKLIVKALQNDKAVYMLLDQRMDDGINVPFLEHEAMTAPAIASLALKYDCPIIPVQVIRKNNSNFEIVFHSPLDYKDKDIRTIMTEINSIIGEWVKANPGQWFWLHNRWKKLR